MLAKALYAVAFVLATACTAALAYVVHALIRPLRYNGGIT